ncbi:hypothetical protein BU23DRAFT_552402 [Bimuria novae-zelandiae CBS 107.79]|uniref:Uncharacterized protein n=1 Tax=Bimuria novae-zelandiae CBS 107.79 TaxID=1447943 RepID=A0A6A5VE42_9PLEO|nr:hypothetical protein BU23DRAFT_552402 [Bimuria novae-zelandiae CBS 107.79]
MLLRLDEQVALLLLQCSSFVGWEMELFSSQAALRKNILSVGAEYSTKREYATLG